MILYDYKKENNKWTRTEVKTLVLDTPEYNFYKKYNFIEEKWYKSQQDIIKYPESSPMYQAAQKKIEILEREYNWLGNFENKPKYNINDTIEDYKRMNLLLMNFVREMLSAKMLDENDKNTEDTMDKVDFVKGVYEKTREMFPEISEKDLKHSINESSKEFINRMAEIR